MLATNEEMRAALPKTVEVYQVTREQAACNACEAQAWWLEECAGEPVVQFAALATENGFEIGVGWWWNEDIMAEQRHGPFVSETAALRHCLTWQRLLINGELRNAVCT